MNDSVNVEIAVWALAAIGSFIWLIYPSKRKSQRHYSTGLPVAYMASLFMIHLFGGIVYALPWYRPTLTYLTSDSWRVDPYVTFEGFRAFALSAIFFAVGSKYVTPLFLKFKKVIPHASKPMQVLGGGNKKIMKAYLMIGLLFGVIFAPFKSVPLMNTISFACSLLLGAVICSNCFGYWQCGDRKKFYLWLIIGMIGMPAFTTITTGFISHGIRVVLPVGIFAAMFFRPRWKVIATVVIGLYLGLTLFVNYQSKKIEFREVAWSNAPVIEKIQATGIIFKNYEAFDLTNNEHLSMIDLRLNQNYYVGRVIEYLDSKQQVFARGKTMLFGLYAFIPRVFWADKPRMAGGTALMSEYTGMQFSDNVSFGIGHVAEHYLNFGYYGIVIGFALIGGALTFLDRNAAACLFNGNVMGFVAWFMPGIGFMQTEGQFSQLLGSIWITVIFGMALNTYMRPHFVTARR